MGDSSYKGVSAAQDSRFSNKESALLRKLKFPAHFDTKVDMRKVELSVIKPWIARRVTELLGFEDDVVLEYASGMLEEERFPDAKKVQIQLMGFLESKTGEFMSELWELLISAQESPGGVPKRFVEEKKEELRRKREEGERVVREARERAQRAAEAAGAGGDTGNRKRKSRWDAAPPPSATNTDGRPPAYGSRGETERREQPPPPPRDEYRQKNDPTRSEWNRRRNQPDTRNRDSGWGSRPSSASRQADSYRPSPSHRRSPSPPSTSTRTRRGSPSPPPPPRYRSRSRSVTPDYRDKMIKRPPRSTKQQQQQQQHDDDDEPERDAYGRDARRSSTKTKDRSEVDFESVDRRHGRNSDRARARKEEVTEEDAYERDAKQSPLQAGSPDDESEDRRHERKRRTRRDDEMDNSNRKQDEAERERQLRDKLLRAKNSRSSSNRDF